MSLSSLFSIGLQPGLMLFLGLLVTVSFSVLSISCKPSLLLLFRLLITDSLGMVRISIIFANQVAFLPRGLGLQRATRSCCSGGEQSRASTPVLDSHERYHSTYLRIYLFTYLYTSLLSPL